MQKTKVIYALLRLAATSLIVAGQACSGLITADNDQSGQVAEVQFALTQIPDGVSCLSIEARPEGDEAIVKNTNVRAGQTAEVTFGGLPPGKVTFVARAYAKSCPPKADATPLFISAPTAVSLNPGEQINLSLVLLKPGSVKGTVDWETNTSACPSGQVKCGAVGGIAPSCKNLQDDAGNCGACGNSCGKGQICIAGMCALGGQSCPAGQLQCPRPDGSPGMCQNHDADELNCGACGNVCLKTQQCVMGACVGGVVCPAGQLQCPRPDGSPGMCQNHDADELNCGSCGNVCLKTQQCVMGACVGGVVCPAGQLQCPRPDGSPGMCQNHDADELNCGSCGNVCLKTQQCVMGACSGGVVCPAGQLQCPRPDGSPGTCQNHDADELNCGACGNVCLKTQQCVMGACSGGVVCPAGQLQCPRVDGSPGVCQSRGADALNCGSCGNVCLKTQQCVMGACVGGVVCPAGQLQCPRPDGSPGTCQNHDGDALNCGACGNVCLKTQQCRGGACQ